MYATSEFPGDSDKELIHAQFEIYGELVSRIFAIARERYLRACELLETDTDLAKLARPMRSFDHRALQYTHDQIASWFRFLHGGGQMRLGEEAESYPIRLQNSWRNFFEREVIQLVDSDAFVRNVLIATAHSNTPKGYDAEEDLRHYLERRYHPMTQAREQGVEATCRILLS